MARIRGRFHPVVARPVARVAIAALSGIVGLVAGACRGSSSTATGDLQLTLTPVAAGLASPVFLTAPAGDARLFVVEQAGRIRIVRGGQLVPTPFLDISAKVQSGGERGLLSMAFDPSYSANGNFFVYYTDLNGDITIERYGSTPGADVANAAGTPVLSIQHRSYANHNGGLVAFGPDGMLYVGTGDGGGGGDPLGNGQNLGVLLGKLLRIDVRTLPYTIPASNPFVGQAGRRGEIWAYGLRNPWRFAFDRGAPGGAALYIADVGQSDYEEIDVAPAATAGRNYGWRLMEGAHCYPAGAACDVTGLALPVKEYTHAGNNCSITGGYVYRGGAIPEVVGHYFYSDYCSGFLASLSGSLPLGFQSHDWSVPNPGNVTSFGEDAAGELYVLSAGGTVYRIARK